MKNIVIIPCSGLGKRMGNNIPKQFIEVDNKPIICYTIEKFENCKSVDEIILAVNEDYIDFFKNYIIKKYNFQKITKIVKGGEERFFSVYNALKVIDNTDSIVIVHDAVRPFIKIKHIEQLIEKTRELGACVLGVKVKDTVKVCESNIVKSTPDRNNIWLAQTPQVFTYSIINNAYEEALKTKYVGTDDASVVENFGEEVFMVEGDYENIKITTPEDLRFF